MKSLAYIIIAIIISFAIGFYFGGDFKKLIEDDLRPDASKSKRIEKICNLDSNTIIINGDTIKYYIQK